MILNNRQIEFANQIGQITIEPWENSRLNPNSYNVTLSPELLMVSQNDHDGFAYDIAHPADTHKIEIPRTGLMLMPGVLYLGQTNEVAGSTRYVPMIEGRSSIGRCGIRIHCTAGFGDVGFIGRWTLEIDVVMPTIIYPNIEIGQVFFYDIAPGGSVYKGQYQHQQEIRPSGIWREIRK